MGEYVAHLYNVGIFLVMLMTILLLVLVLFSPLLTLMYLSDSNHRLYLKIIIEVTVIVAVILLVPLGIIMLDYLMEIKRAT